MKNTPLPFGKAHSDAAQALAQLRLAEFALHFVDRGLSDPHTPSSTSTLSTLSLLVRNQLLDQAAGGGLVPDARRLAQVWRKGAWPQALVAAHRALLNDFADTATPLFGRIAPPWMGAEDKAAEVRVAEEICGLAPADEPQDPDPIRQAYAMARFNTLRCEQRLALLYLLAQKVRTPHRSELPNAAAQTEFELASRHLWTTRALHLSRVLALGTLLGGEALEQNKLLVKAMYGEGMSVIELLQVDGRIPGRWQAHTEDGLRQAIARA